MRQWPYGYYKGSYVNTDADITEKYLPYSQTSYYNRYHNDGQYLWYEDPINEYSAVAIEDKYANFNQDFTYHRTSNSNRQYTLYGYVRTYVDYDEYYSEMKTDSDGNYYRDYIETAYFNDGRTPESYTIKNEKYTYWRIANVPKVTEVNGKWYPDFYSALNDVGHYKDANGKTWTPAFAYEAYKGSVKLRLRVCSKIAIRGSNVGDNTTATTRLIGPLKIEFEE